MEEGQRPVQPERGAVVEGVHAVQVEEGSDSPVAGDVHVRAQEGGDGGEGHDAVERAGEALVGWVVGWWGVWSAPRAKREGSGSDIIRDGGGRGQLLLAREGT